MKEPKIIRDWETTEINPSEIAEHLQGQLEKSEDASSKWNIYLYHGKRKTPSITLKLDPDTRIMCLLAHRSGKGYSATVEVDIQNMHFYHGRDETSGKDSNTILFEGSGSQAIVSSYGHLHYFGKGEKARQEEKSGQELHFNIRESPAQRLRRIIDIAQYKGAAEFIIKALDVFEYAVNADGKIIVEDTIQVKRFTFDIMHHEHEQESKNESQEEMAAYVNYSETEALVAGANPKILELLKQIQSLGEAMDRDFSEVSPAYFTESNPIMHNLVQGMRDLTEQERDQFRQLVEEHMTYMPVKEYMKIIWEKSFDTIFTD
jgi:hypothetical protein